MVWFVITDQGVHAVFFDEAQAAKIAQAIGGVVAKAQITKDFRS